MLDVFAISRSLSAIPRLILKTRVFTSSCVMCWLQVLGGLLQEITCFPSMFLPEPNGFEPQQLKQSMVFQGSVLHAELIYIVYIPPHTLPCHDQFLVSPA